jgi:hypothetical protein
MESPSILAENEHTGGSPRLGAFEARCQPTKCARARIDQKKVSDTAHHDVVRQVGPAVGAASG